MRWLAVALLLAAPALAQEQPAATLDQRIGAQIGALVIQNAGLQMQLEQAQAALKAAQDRAKACEPPPAPKKD